MATTVRKPSSKARSTSELQELARKHLWLHFTRMGGYLDEDVPIIVRGDGCYLEDINGKELVRSDDANGSSDPRVEWKAPTSGKFFLAVGSLIRNPGTNAFYRVSIRRQLPDFKATLGAAAYRVTAGSTNDLKISIQRLAGFDHKLDVAARGLPKGVLCDAVDVPEKGGDVILKLRVNDAARPSSQPFQLFVRDSTAAAERVLAAPLTGSSTANGVPGGYSHLLIDSIDELWLTVLPKPVEEKK